MSAWQRQEPIIFRTRATAISRDRTTIALSWGDHRAESLSQLANGNSGFSGPLHFGNLLNELRYEAVVTLRQARRSQAASRISQKCAKLHQQHAQECNEATLSRHVQVRVAEQQLCLLDKIDKRAISSLFLDTKA